ncbi:MAG TPA: recombinase RecB [Micromonosporaceae bacterium]|nr:recombinase RecB [Micromonosporaceae bacterium]
MSHPAGSISGVRTPKPRSEHAGEQLGFDLMPERLFVCTPSRLANFTDCPRRYRHTYLDRPTPSKGPAWAHNSVGASVHTALRNWWDLAPERRNPSALGVLLRATWVREGYRDEAQEREVFGRALRWLETYVGDLDPDFEPLAVERTVAAKTSVLAFSGRTDRIDRRADELVIVDYKTGRSGLDSDDARGSQALALYAFAAERTFRRKCLKVELHHLPSGTVAAHEHTPESIARQVKRAEDTAKDIVSAEKSLADGVPPDEAFPMSPGAMCSWCDFRKVCPAGEQAPQREPWAGLEVRI